MRKGVLAAALFVLALPGAPNAGEALTLQVSRAVVPAPGWINVRTIIEDNDDNRLLEVIALSDDFSRRSVYELDGKFAPRVKMVEYQNLPSGRYEIRAVLVGTSGVRATATRVVDVVPMAGAR